MLAARAGLVPGLPLMHPAFYIRPARVEEAAALSDLCFRSKAVWGYDPEFMALMLAALGVAGEADPNAAAFYERAGAVRIGEAPSDAVPGRLLPLYEVRLDSTGDRDLEPHLGGISKR